MKMKKLTAVFMGMVLALGLSFSAMAEEASSEEASEAVTEASRESDTLQMLQAATYLNWNRQNRTQTKT